MKPFRAYKPDALEQSTDFNVTARYRDTTTDVYCAHATVGNRFQDYSMAYEKMSFCSMDCDFSAPLTITITPNRAFGEAVIRPKSANITCTADDTTVTVTLTKPVKFSVEFDGDLYHNLFVYVNPPVEEPEGDNVRYYGPGAHDIGEMRVGSGETLYLDGDAVLFGALFAEGDNITVCGRGIISGGKLNHKCGKHRAQLFHGQNCTGLCLDGIMLLDSPAWTVCTVNCRNVEIRNLKQICYNPNSDGFDICSCEDVRITDCFVRNFDDNISIKSFGGDNRNITVTNTVMWADCAHNMLIGPESRPESEDCFCHILFKNIDVLEHKEYSDFFMGVMAIFCADKASFYDIEWNNIRIERMTCGRLFDFNYVDAFATTFGKSVRDIRMKNITCEAPVLFRSRIRGMDEEHTMDGITMENFRIHGIPVKEGEPSVIVGDYVTNLEYK